MTPSRPGEVIATIRSLLPSLLPTEQAVAQVLLARSAEIVELSSQQVAELAGASRATVVRTCQSLGFSGYQQLRVLLARDAAVAATAHDGTGSATRTGSPTADDGTPGARPAAAGSGSARTPSGIVEDTFRQVAAGVVGMVALLDGDEVARAVEAIATARRVVVVGNGLSGPLALDAAARLTGAGRPAEAPFDVINQQITARLLAPEDVLLVISGSGSNAASLRSADAAVAAGATVIAVTAFARSPLTQLAGTNLVVTMPDLTFRDEITLASRLPQAILVEGLVAAVTARLGESAVRAKALALDAISDNLAE
ncbi:transcriptional regulator [Luteimicrobium album]|uniref:Transcriptional regulator n=1 Tax=Luteimicrobium album TaxID=1054550 RepID=A0ABQ6I295_9MICO|nr:MurR/RpiR family transcriptional regulator [Luteimicrobium album]GMA24620.1 transcriptional regulator [Luteimicrobium album]